MPIPSLASRRLRFSVALLLVPLAALPACTKAPGGFSCPALTAAEGGVQAIQSAANAVVTGAGVSATFCNISVYTEGGYGSSSPFFFNFDSTGPGSSSSIGAPASGTAGTLRGSIAIGDASPGVYQSSDASPCESLLFSYGIPLATDAECAAGDAQTACPKGCTSTFQFCTSFPCCVPLATTYVFQANGDAADSSAVTCGTTSNAPLGSWTLTLASIVSEDGGDGVIAHGSLSATLQGTSGNDETVSLSLTF